MSEPKKKKKSKSNAIVWVILGLLILSLGGFGIGGFGGSLSSVAEVGDRDITVQDYANAIQGEQRRLQQQTGQPLTLQQMQAFGLDQAVMERLLMGAALIGEAERMAVSVGDAEVARRIRAEPSFNGLDGTFDREGYAEALRFANLDERQYERQVRDEAALDLLQAAVIGGVSVPAPYADAVAGWMAERRDLTVATITDVDLEAGPISPSAADLRTFHEDQADLFRTPERRRITYVTLRPEDVAETVEVDEEALRALYDGRLDSYVQPPRVLAERLAFADTEAAQTALDAIEAGETTFDEIVTDRGLTLQDVDQGELARDDLDAAVAEALFALDEPGVVGPVDTPLGPALYRVNAILNATEVPFEDVRDTLATELAQDEARRIIDASREDIDDLLAGGATLEEVADETEATLDSIDYDPSVRGDIASDAAFRLAAQSVTADDFPELDDLSDGGVFALRLEEIVPPALPPLADVREEVEAAWRADQTRTRLLDRAEAAATAMAEGGDFAEAGLTGEPVTNVARDGQQGDLPRTVIERAFAAEAGEVFAIEGDDERAFVVRVDAVNPADLEDGEGADLRAAIISQTRQEVAGDVLDAYGRAVQANAGFTVNAQAVQAVQSQLLGIPVSH